MTRNAAARSGTLWAITSYFNPLHYRRRLATYHGFRHRLQVPLAAIELSFDGRYELGAGDADLLVQLRGEDVMWQKERLLNILLPHLPAECRQVAWLDCDIVFERQDWPERIADALARAPLVQPFRRLHYMPPHAGPDDVAESITMLTRESLGSWLQSGQSVDDAMRHATTRRSDSAVKGLAWAASRDLLETHGFYDACIVGGGANALACAALGTYEHAMRPIFMNDRQRGHYLAWAERFHRATEGGSISCIDGDVYHLWHGDLANRGGSARHKGLVPFEFDPGADIAISGAGCWRWATDKRDMHRFVRDYFAARKEDG
jgi:hypothetical protein